MAAWSTTTYCLKLHCKRRDWILKTQALYNDVLSFYSRLLLNDVSLLELDNMKLLRKLEQMTIAGRDKKQPEVELPFPKLPLYFRRAAINAAIGMIRSYTGRLRGWEKAREDARKKGLIWNRKPPAAPSHFHASTVLYKGMYKQFGQGRILIKLWTGGSWSWVGHAYSGRSIPPNARTLSPSIVARGKLIFLHVPVSCPVEDIRSVRERNAAGEPFCGVSFSASDVMAACVVFSGDGRANASYFVRGGKAFAHRRKRLLNMVKKRRGQTGGKLVAGENARLWRKYRNLRMAYAHLVSRRILDFCIRHKVKTIVIAQYSYDEQKKRYYGRGIAAFPGKQVSAYLKYKAWRAGIIVTSVPPEFTASKCSACGAPVKRYNEHHQASANYFGGRLFICPNGHRGNASYNAAVNIGKAFIRKFTNIQEEKAG